MAKKTDNEKIIAAMDALGKSVRMLQGYAERFNDHIDRAFMREDDAAVRRLIRQKHGVLALADRLDSLKNNIELSAISASAISKLSKLPEAVAGCKGLLTEKPDIQKLGKSISSIFSDLRKSESEIDNLLGVLDPQPTENFEAWLDGGASVKDEEKSDWFQAELKAAEMRNMPKLSDNAVVHAEEAAATGDIDYEGIIEEEKKRK